MAFAQISPHQHYAHFNHPPTIPAPKLPPDRVHLNLIFGVSMCLPVAWFSRLQGWTATPDIDEVTGGADTWRTWTIWFLEMAFIGSASAFGNTGLA
jgi:hypothetical protein